MYSDLYLRPNKNKYLISLAAVVVVLFSFFLYYGGVGSLPSKAVVKSLKRHEVANLLATQTSVYWITEKEETGWLLYGENQDGINQIALDDRDIAGQKTKSYFHVITIKNLRPDNQYYYKIVSDNAIIETPSRKYFSFRTPKNDIPAVSTKPAYGKVISVNGNPVENALVIYRYGGAYPLVSLTKMSGEWLIPLQNIVDVNANKFIPVDEGSTVKIEVTDGHNEITSIDALMRLTNPISQTIILGKNYAFMSDPNVLPASTSSVEAPQKEYDLNILLPKENTLIPASRPLLKGQATPGREVTIRINSEPEYITRIKANSVGTWYVDVPVSFIAGSYVMTVSAKDANGNEIALKRKFSIAKSGEQVLGDATPSGTLTPTATPSATLTATPSATPLITFTPSPTITQPLFTATPIASLSPSILLTSGAFDSNPILWGSLGLMAIGASLLFIF